MYKIYLDSCVYNRPFDDYHENEKIFIEAAAFYVILHWVENGRITIVNSDALVYESERIADEERKKRVKTYLARAVDFIELSDQTIQRAREISQYGLKSLDALHISLAEHGMADYFVTCDDGIIKKGNAAQEKLKVKICGVLEFLSEVMYAENIEGN